MLPLASGISSAPSAQTVPVLGELVPKVINVAAVDHAYSANAYPVVPARDATIQPCGGENAVRVDVSAVSTPTPMMCDPLALGVMVIATGPPVVAPD